MHAAAFRRFRLVAPRQPIRIFSRAVALHFELRPAHILKLDLNRIAGIHGAEPLMIGAGGDNVAVTVPETSPWVALASRALKDEWGRAPVLQAAE